MRAYDVIGYADFDAQCHWCADCAPDEAETDNGEKFGAIFPGSETDCPNHCSECGELIPETLTSDGVEYVRRALVENHQNGRGDSDVLDNWCAEFGFTRVADIFDKAELVELLRAVRDEASTFNPEDIADDDGNPSIDVRVCVDTFGAWDFHSGQACYDTDRNGYWGYGSVGPDDTDADLEAIADEMIQEAIDAYCA